MQFRNILVGVSLAALTTSVAMAKGKKEPNCDVNGKKIHVKDEAACTKKKGTWSAPADTSKPADAPAAATAPAAAPAAPAAAPATDAPK